MPWILTGIAPQSLHPETDSGAARVGGAGEVAKKEKLSVLAY